VDSFRRIYAFVQYVDEQLCPPDAQGIHPDLTMTVLQRFDSKNFRKLFMKSGGRFHTKFHKAWKLVTAELRERREDTLATLSHLLSKLPNERLMTPSMTVPLNEDMAIPKSLRLLRRISLKTKITIMILVPTMDSRTLTNLPAMRI